MPRKRRFCITEVSGMRLWWVESFWGSSSRRHGVSMNVGAQHKSQILLSLPDAGASDDVTGMEVLYQPT
jgi:hypothetical protein